MGAVMGAGGRGSDDPNCKASSALLPTALQKRYDELSMSALADAAAALDVGLDGGVRADGNDISEKSRRRLMKAAHMVGAAQAARLGDSIEPRSAEFIAAGSLGGCADKAAMEAAIEGAWGTAAAESLLPIEVEATCEQIDT